MDEENNTNKYVTGEYLDKRLSENNQIILSAVDSILIKRLEESDTRTGSRFDAMANRLDSMESQLGNKADNVQTLIDGYVKAQEDFKQEFTVMREEFRQMKQIIKEKLGIEIRAM
ncbi:MAG: hypothetical protein WA055_02200 [Candidatus Moraniibacteriota bacterium]